MPQNAAQRLTCRVVGLEQATHDIRIVALEPEGEAWLAFQAGQYAAVRFGDLAARDYSMANRPDERCLVFHIRAMSRDGASAFVAERLTLGDAVEVEGPLGEAHLRADHKGPILAIAGGSGLAPMTSIVETALAADPGRPIALYFGVRRPEDLYHLDRFGQLAERHPGFRIVPVVDELGTDASPTHRRGPVSRVLLAETLDLAGTKAYLAGPPAMVEATVATLATAGLPPGDIHADPFINEHEKPDANAPATDQTTGEP